MARKKTHKLDADTIRKLSGLLPATNDYTVEIKLSIYDNVDEEYRPTFIMSPLNNKELKDLSKKYSTAEDMKEEEVLELVSKHLVDVNNLIDITTGEPVEYTPEVFETIPTVVKAALVTELMSISGLKINV